MNKAEKELKYLPLSIVTAYEKLNDEQKLYFAEAYQRDRVSPSVIQITTILGLHYLFLGKFGIFLVFFFTGGGALIWWLYDITRGSKLADNANAEVCMKILKDIKILHM
jgi:hypothetical protein